MSDNNENIKLDNGWATTEVSPDGVITLTIKRGEKPTVYNFEAEVGGSVRSSKDKVVIKDGHGGSRTFTKDSPQQSLENQAKEAIRTGCDNTLRDLVDEKGLSVNAVIPETGRTLLQELCVTGSDEGFAYCLRVLLVRGVDTRSRVSGTDETILHLLAEHGSLLKWEITVNELNKETIDELLCTTDNEGNTPLHKAAERGRMDIYSLVDGLCGPYSKQSETKNKAGNTPYEVLYAKSAELRTAVYAHTKTEEEYQRLTRDPWFRNIAYNDMRKHIMLWHMTRYFYNAIHHRHLYGEEEAR